MSPLHQFSIAGYDEKSGELIIKVVNADETIWHPSVTIKNGGILSPEGEVITLSSANLKDENSFEEPLRISPKSVKYNKFSKDFDFEFAPGSFTILRVKVAR